MKTPTLLLSLMLPAILLSSPLFGDAEAKRPLLIPAIAENNLQSFENEDEDEWDEGSYEKFFIRYFNERLNPKPRTKRAATFKLFKVLERNQEDQAPSIIHDTSTWQDLDLFCGKSNKGTYLGNVIDRTQTELGSIALYNILARPTANTAVLTKRQMIIKTLLENKSLLEGLTTALTALKTSENAFLGFWGQDFIKKDVRNEYLFSFPLFKPLNNSETALLASNIYGNGESMYWLAINCMAAVFLTSYGVMELANPTKLPDRLKKWADDEHQGHNASALAWKKNIPPIKAGIAILGGLYAGHNAYKNIKYRKALFTLEKCLQETMIHVATFVGNMQNLYGFIKQNPHLRSFNEFKGLTEFFETTIAQDSELRSFIELLHADTFQSEASFFSHKGNIIRAYSLMHAIKDSFGPALAAIGALDAYASTAHLVQEFASKHVSYSFPVYLKRATPSLTLTDFWHPFIAPDMVIPNSITLGSDGERQNIVLTGPNEGGKSTILKALAISLIMAQSLGVAPVKAMSFTPFHSIATYLNITDDVGGGNSLFKAEVLRTQELINRIADAPQGQFVFSIFDEIFNGTSPVEGTAAAYSVAKHLSTFRHSICVVATHFDVLTKLETATNQFTNYKVSIIRNADGSLTYPYTIEKGISTQHIALDVLRNQGFEGSIINEAQAMIKEIRARS